MPVTVAAPALSHFIFDNVAAGLDVDPSRIEADAFSHPGDGGSLVPLSHRFEGGRGEEGARFLRQRREGRRATQMFERQCCVEDFDFDPRLAQEQAGLGKSSGKRQVCGF